MVNKISPLTAKSYTVLCQEIHGRLCRVLAMQILKGRIWESLRSWRGPSRGTWVHQRVLKSKRSWLPKTRYHWSQRLVVYKPEVSGFLHSPWRKLQDAESWVWSRKGRGDHRMKEKRLGSKESQPQEWRLSFWVVFKNKILSCMMTLPQAQETLASASQVLWL